VKPAPSKVLVFNGLRFAVLNKSPEACPGGMHGFYRANDKGIHLYDTDRKIQAYIVRNARQGHFVVTAFEQPDGKLRYMHSTCSLTEKWLAIDTPGYAATINLIENLRFDEAQHALPTQAATLHE
jgi:hypothetical protein